jgi:signal transduction histidine kinase
MSVSIRTRLLLLVLALLLPGILGLGILVANTYRAEREANLRMLRDTARALGLVVEVELRRRAAIAQVLSGSRWLDGAPAITPDELRGFERLARRALPGIDGWIELRAPHGVLLDTRPAGNMSAMPLPSADDAPPFELSDLRFVSALRSADSGVEAHAAIVEPVQRNGRTLLNLAITIRPQELQQLIDAQDLPEGWFGTVLDGRARVVASHPGGHTLIGWEAPAELRAQLTARREGLFESQSPEGQRHTAYFSTTAQGWTYVTAMPSDQFHGLLPRSALHVAGVALALLALGVLGAIGVARRIVGSVGALNTAASQLQAGEVTDLRATGIVECDKVADALARASETLRNNRAQLERQVQQAVERTREAEQRASQGQRTEALGRLTGGVAHDFNNLLGVVSNSAHLIERHPAAAELQLPLGGIRRAISVGSHLTQHLLRIAGRRSVQPRAIDLGGFLHEMQELLRSVLGKNIAVSAEVAADTRAVRVDAGELELAVINLALNARDAMPKGGALRLRARNAAREETEGLSGHPERAYVLVTVGDDGSGIEPEVVAHAFEPFYTTKPIGKGSGLGLSQVLGFCVQAGGTARLASTPGLGTTVSLVLPATTREEAPTPSASPGTDARAQAAMAGTTVLLVEDNEELAQLTLVLLQLNGFKVRRAADAAQALRLLAVPHDVDLVLSDIVMPGAMDGLMLAQQLRRDQPALPVVLVSGYSKAAAPTGDFVVLRKPYTEDALLNALSRALGGSR